MRDFIPDSLNEDARALVTISLGKRPFAQFTQPLMELYAARIGAALHVVSELSHAALHDSRNTRSRTLEPRFLKLPVLAYFLSRYARVLYLDDDVLVSPWTPDLFRLVSCDALGATIEHHQPQGWHTMHWRAACKLYSVPECSPDQWQLFNSGVMLLSHTAHAPLFSKWREDPLTCQVLIYTTPIDELHTTPRLRHCTGAGTRTNIILK